MNTRRMDTPRTRREFENRMNLLEESLKNGKLHISRDCVALIDGFLRVRRMQNGRLDLLTVDEPVRLQANMMAKFNMPDKEVDE